MIEIKVSKDFQFDGDVMRPSSDKLFSDAANRLFLPTRAYLKLRRRPIHGQFHLGGDGAILRFHGFFIRNVLY